MGRIRQTNAPCSRLSTNAIATVSWPVSAGTKTVEGTAVGSLLLGLYNHAGKLQHVGVCASFTAAKRKELANFLAPYREDAMRDHPWADWADEAAQASGRMPGGQSRWNAGKDLSWEPVRIELVVEVAYEHMQGDRFRHLAHFRRWRPDKPPKDCTYEQLEVVPPQELMSIFPERAQLSQCQVLVSCQARVGSSSGSGTPCAGRISSGTCRKFTRMRYHTYADPRMRSTSTSSGASSAAASGCCCFQRSSPASAAPLSGDCAITINGMVGFRRPFFGASVAAGSDIPPPRHLPLFSSFAS